MENITRILSVPIFLFFFVSCEGMTDPDSSDGHGCTVEDVNGHWYNQDLKLYHTDSRSCPHQATSGDIVSAGGKIEDTKETWPESSGNENTWEATLDIYNSYSGCGQSSSGAWVGGTSELFSWTDIDGDGTPEWNAGLWTDFEAGTGADPGRDCPEFHVALIDEWPEEASAWTMIDYWDEQW